MKVYGATLPQLEQAAQFVPCKLQNVKYGRTYIQFVIRPTQDTSEVLRSTGHNGRRVHALSYYGHKVFMDALFDLCPTCRLTSSNPTQDYGKSRTVSYDGRESYRTQVYGR